MIHDIRACLSQANIPYKDRGVNVGRSDVNICCVYCSDERYHLAIHEEKLYYQCWVCGAKGPWFKLARTLKQQYPQINWHGLQVETARYIPVETPAPITNPSLYRLIEDGDTAIQQWFETMPDIANLSDPHRSRGINFEIAKQCGLYQGIQKLDGYAVFVQDENIIARKYNPSGIGTKWWKDIKGDAFLFNKQFLKMVQPNNVVITEGIFDCLRLPLGFSVAVLGSIFSPSLIDEILMNLKVGTRIIMALDRDVSEDVYKRYVLAFQDLGFPVTIIDWHKVPNNVKDLDEFYLCYGYPALLEFIGSDFQEIYF